VKTSKEIWNSRHYDIRLLSKHGPLMQAWSKKNNKKEILTLKLLLKPQTL
jgi:hypothetical protein